MYIFEAKNIVKKYANHTALNNVSIEVPRNSIFGLLGPNGAGKTSLIRIINQITGPDSGELFFNGEPLRRHHVEKIGYLPEERGLYKKMTVGEQSLYLAQLKGLSKKEAISRLKYWFEKFEMQTWWNKKVEELSKGMQQKVQFVVTILHQPELLIFDEPFSGFDPINADLLKQEILSLKEKGSTIIFSTHNMSSVEELCDDIALINHSEKILSGNVTDIRRKYKSNKFHTVIHSNNINSIKNLLSSNYEILEETKNTDYLEAMIQSKMEIKSNELLSELIKIGDISSFKEVLPSMNDIFISCVKAHSSEKNQTVLN